MIRRRLFPITSAISLLLCLATAVLWVRSYFYQEGIVTPFNQEWGGGVVASRGSLFTFAFHFQGFNRVEQFRVVNDSIPPDLMQEIGDFHSFAGFAYRWERGFVYAVAVPLWLVLALFLAVLFFLIRRLRPHPAHG